MAKLDDPSTRTRLLALIAAGEGKRPACKAVGVGRTTLDRYMRANPKFADAVHAASDRGELPAQSDAKPIIAEVVSLDERRPAAGSHPYPARWWEDIDGITERFAAVFDDEDENPGLRATCGRAIFAKASAEHAAEPAGDYVTVDLPPKEELAEG